MGKQTRRKGVASKTGVKNASPPQKLALHKKPSAKKKRGPGHKLFEAVINALPDSGMIIDENGYLISWNKAAQEKFSRKAVPGESRLFDVFPHVTQEFWRKTFFRCFESRKAIRFERHDSGQYYFHHIHPVLNEKGSIKFFVVFVQDITSYRYAENALKESEQKYRELVENVSDAIYALNEEGDIIYINPAVHDFLGYQPDQITGRPLIGFLHTSDVLHIENDLKGFLSGTLQQTDYRFIHKNGALRWGRISSQPVVFKNQVIGYQGVITDITKDKSFNINLLKVVQDNILTNLATSFSDEISVPLKRARERLLARQKESGDAGVIDESFRDLMHDLEGISLFLKNMNAFMENINEETTVADINALVENALILLKRQFSKKGIEIHTELSRHVEPVTVDSFALVQVFINIFNYSISSRSTHAEKSHLTVVTGMEKDKAVVDIIDRYAAVSADLMTRLADPFYLHRRRKGAAIGLAVARQLVENQSGEFSIVPQGSEPGLHIRIVLPAVIPSL